MAVGKGRECVRIFGSAGAGVSWRALGLKSAGAHSTRSLKISGCKRWCLKDLRVRAPAAPMLTHFLKGARKCQPLISTTHILPTYMCIWDFAHRLGWNFFWLELGLFLQLHTHWALLSVSSSLKPLLCCFEHFCARNISKIRLRFVIWAFSTLRNQICSLKAGFTTRKTSFLPLINTIPTPADTLKVLSSNNFLLNLMYLLRQYIY